MWRCSLKNLMKMTPPEITERIKKVFVDEFELEAEKLVPEATLYEDLGLDSLDAVDMVVALEKEFGVKLKDEEAIREIRTMGDLFDFIEKIGGQESAS